MGKHAFRAALVMALAASGCSVIVDGTLSDKGDAGGLDASPTGDAGPACVGASDGETCGSGLVCIGEACVTSRCGDGFIDTSIGEECEDGNNVPGDGCEPDLCLFTCTSVAQCNDANTCNGDEACEDNRCVVGDPPDDGAACTQDDSSDGVCRAGDCVAPGCGNGAPDSGEDCDDGNMVDGDGCDSDCTFSCISDDECNDGDVCTGQETCDTESNTCMAGTALDCSDGDDCTADECDATDGCENPLIDEDNDGHAPTSLGACGDDCDDTEPTIFGGAEELCDGLDNNCDGSTDETAPTWYIDCDGDGYAVDTTGARDGCEAPPPTSCGGGWTSRRPVPGDVTSVDCNDSNEDVRPGQRSYFGTPIPGAPASRDYDYDCDGNEEPQYGCAIFSCTSSSGGCTGSTQGYIDSCTFPPTCPGFCLATQAPPCGTTETYRTSCFRFSTTCLSPTREQQQRCQ